MKLFLKNILIVCIPTAAVLCYILIIFFTHNLHQLYESDINDKKIILGEPYNDNLIRHYKLNRSIDDYEMLAIGSSRVLQFSHEMFPQKFFNLGYTVMNVRQTKPDRRFSAITIEMPTSIPITSGAYQPASGLNASMNP